MALLSSHFDQFIYFGSIFDVSDQGMKMCSEVQCNAVGCMCFWAVLTCVHCVVYIPYNECKWSNTGLMNVSFLKKKNVQTIPHATSVLETVKWIHEIEWVYLVRPWKIFDSKIGRWCKSRYRGSFLRLYYVSFFQQTNSHSFPIEHIHNSVYLRTWQHPFSI